jgi:hypothetical protein
VLGSVVKYLAREDAVKFLRKRSRTGLREPGPRRKSRFFSGDGGALSRRQRYGRPHFSGPGAGVNHWDHVGIESGNFRVTTPPKSFVTDQHIRRSPRFPLISVAEIAHAESEGQLGARATALSLNGRYAEMKDALPIGSNVAILIFAESACFSSAASVVYAFQRQAWDSRPRNFR